MSPAEYEAMQRRCLNNLEVSLREVDVKIGELQQLRKRMHADITALWRQLSHESSSEESR